MHQPTRLAPIAPAVEGGLLVGTRTGDDLGQGDSEFMVADIVKMMTVQRNALFVESEGGSPVFHLSPRPTPQMFAVDFAGRCDALARSHLHPQSGSLFGLLQFVTDHPVYPVTKTVFGGVEFQVQPTLAQAEFSQQSIHDR